MEDGVRRQRRRQQRAVEAATRLRETAKLMGLAIKRTAALDIECERLDQHARGELSTLEQRLGRMIALRNFRLSDVGIAWADRAAFKQSVRSLEGVARADDDAALDGLFTLFDTSCSGSACGWLSRALALWGCFFLCLSISLPLPLYLNLYLCLPATAQSFQSLSSSAR